MAAARQGPSRDRRTAAKDGLACTIVHVVSPCDTPALIGPRSTIWMPSRRVTFHLPSVRPALTGIRDDEARATVTFLPRVPEPTVSEGSVA